MKCIFYPYRVCDSCGECSLCCTRFTLDYQINECITFKIDNKFKCDSCKANKCFCCINSTIADNQVLCKLKKEDVLL